MQRCQPTHAIEFILLVRSAFFHNDKQPTALALYGGVLWLQRKYSAAIRVLAQVRLQSRAGKGSDEGWQMEG